MKKKTLIILLIIPFLIALFTFVSIQVMNITLGSDITGISWDYDLNEGFKIDDSPYTLKAKRIINENLYLKDGNDLVWEVSEVVPTNEGDEVCRIESNNESCSFYALSEGSCRITCSNENKTVSVYMNVKVFKNALIVINARSKSGEEVNAKNRIASLPFYGEYDLEYSSVSKDNYRKKEATFNIDFEVLGDSSGEVSLEKCSSGVSVDLANKKVSIDSIDNSEDTTRSFFTLSAKDSEGYSISTKYEFNVVNDGVNVYNYNDLLMTTNFSSKGEITVLQTNLGSLSEVYEGEYVALEGYSGENASEYGFIKFVPKVNSNGELIKKEGGFSEVFGNYDIDNGSLSFANEVYRYSTNYNHEFIDQLNESGLETSKEVLVGIHVQKDFYGNGFSINGNELCFPKNGSIDSSKGRLTPGENDLFKGPLNFVSIGNSSGDIVKAYGEDNSLLYIDCDNVKVSDLTIKNIDDNKNRANYAYIGSVINVKGENVTIEDSILSHGKNIVVAFSSDNLLIKNSILTRSGEFNLMVGNYEYSKANENNSIDLGSDFANLNTNSTYFTDFNEFFNTSKDSGTYSFDDLVDILLGFRSDGKTLADLNNSEKEGLYNVLNKCQSYLDNKSSYLDSDGNVIYGSNITLDSVLFGDSGIFSIAFETLFNGCFLYNAFPSTVKSILTEMFGSVAPSNIGGTSNPVKVILKGNSKFYDWKNVADIDVNCLIDESIGAALASLGKGGSYTIDDFFPMKSILLSMCENMGYVYKKDGKNYINSMIAYYGGGLNLSTLVNEVISGENTFSSLIDVDLLYNAIFVSSSGESSTLGQIVTILAKCVLFAAGFNPFRFITNGVVNNNSNIDLEKSPSLDDLKSNKISEVVL